MSRVEKLLVTLSAFALASCGENGLKMGWPVSEAPSSVTVQQPSSPISSMVERSPASQPDLPAAPSGRPASTREPGAATPRQDSGQSPRPAPTPSPRPTSDTLLDDVLELTNIFRARHGLDLIEVNSQLADAAQRYADRMADGDFFDHQSPEGDSSNDRIRDAGYRCQTCAENIAMDYSTPAAVMKGWIDSPAHRANLLNPDFTELGLGYATGTSRRSGRKMAYWVQEFGAPKSR